MVYTQEVMALYNFKIDQQQTDTQTHSIFINSLIVLSVGAFVFASITVWYMFVEKLHRWKEKREKKREINIGYKSKYNQIMTITSKQMRHIDAITNAIMT